MEKILRAKYVGWNSHALSGHSSSLEHHHILSSGIFMEASSWRHGPSLTPSSPSSLPEGWRVVLEVSIMV